MNFAVVFSEELFDGCICLIVGYVEGGGVTVVSQCCVDLFEGSEDCGIGGGRNRNSEDVVGIVVVSDEEVLVAVNGSCRKCPCAVCVECTMLFVGKSCVTKYVGDLVHADKGGVVWVLLLGCGVDTRSCAFYAAF